MKIVSMSTISNVADITHAWAEITIWYLAENHVLIVTGSMPALRPFWRTFLGKWVSFKSGSYSYEKDPSDKQKAGGTNGSFPLRTIGSEQKRHGKKGAPLGPYSVEIPGDSSEESLERQLQGRQHSPTGHNGADTESVEVILPKTHGSTKATITSGGLGGRGDHTVGRPRRNSDGRIEVMVTKEYQVREDREA
jgi:hypothetical protein